jgi:hypothetical protein
VVVLFSFSFCHGAYALDEGRSGERLGLVVEVRYSIGVGDFREWDERGGTG